MTYRQIILRNKEYTLARQLLRSGTSIGANIEEAIGGQSRRDFIAKMAISYKEARESCYWIRLLLDTGYLNSDEARKLLFECNEIVKIIASILLTTKKNS